MSTTCICVRYLTRSDGEGCTSILLPNWLDSGTLPNQRGFIRLAAKFTGYADNREQINQLHAWLTAESARAKAEAERTRVVADKQERAKAREDKARARKRHQRCEVLLEYLHEAMSKYE